MATVKITRWGGIKPLIGKRNLADHMLVMARDVNLVSGYLQPWRTPKKKSSDTGKALWVEDCCIKTFADCGASVAYHRMGEGRIIATGTGVPYPVTGTLKEFCAGDVCRLGFPCDLPAPTVAAQAPKRWEAHDDLRQHRAYAYRLVNRYNEVSQISLPSESVDIDALAHAVITLPTSFPSYCVESIEILRTEQSPDRSGAEMSSNFFVVGEVDFGVSTFTDLGQVVMEMVDGDDELSPPPDDLHDVAYLENGTFIGLSGDNIVISNENEHHGWASSQYKDLHDKPRALVAGTNIAYIATDARPASIVINGGKINPPTESKDTHPIVSQRSMVAYNNHALYASNDGIVMVSPSADCKILTAEHYTKEQWQAMRPDTAHAVVHDGHYFCFFENETIRFRIPDGVYEQHGDIGLTTLSMRPTAAHRGLDDELYYTDAQGVWQWNAGNSFLTFRVESAPLDTAGIYEFAAFKVTHAHSPVTIETWCDNERIDLDIVDHSEPVWLPPIRSGISWAYSIECSGEVYEYMLSTSIHDLAQK
jgi:hypothetical protein